ncbi:MAG: helix-turn-helix domain-containing protein [Treponema sp.]|jgi:transcriptional regulator with XRE-family HTH domain|nr:helix-turn-helix domain-containing protein [Treponema sp.]
MTGADLRQILSKNLKRLRSQRSLSQEELAEKAEISIPFLSNIERSNKWPYPDTLVRLARALDVEVAALFQDDAPQPADAQVFLAQFKTDMAVSLHKTVSNAIDESLKTIGSHYISSQS